MYGTPWREPWRAAVASKEGVGAYGAWASCKVWKSDRLTKEGYTDSDRCFACCQDGRYVTGLPPWPDPCYGKRAVVRVKKQDGGCY